MSKYDIFKVSCGFLTEDEEARYRKIDKFDGTIMSLLDPQELWCDNKSFLERIQEDQTVDPFKYDLSDFSLWQIDDQNRFEDKNIFHTKC